MGEADRQFPDHCMRLSQTNARDLGCPLPTDGKEGRSPKPGTDRKSVLGFALLRLSPENTAFRKPAFPRNTRYPQCVMARRNDRSTVCRDLKTLNPLERGYPNLDDRLHPPGLAPVAPLEPSSMKQEFGVSRHSAGLTRAVFKIGWPITGHFVLQVFPYTAVLKESNEWMALLLSLIPCQIPLSQ